MKRSTSSNRLTTEDHGLVDRLRAGDEAAFAEILDAWSGGMHRLAVSYVGELGIGGRGGAGDMGCCDREPRRV